MLQHISKDSIKKRILLLTSGTFIAQCINIGLTPLITRIYKPEEYGIISVFTSVLLLFTILGTLNYELAIPISANDRESYNIIILSIIILSFTSLLIVIALFFWGDVFLMLLQAEKIIRYKYMIPLGVFMIGFYSVLTQWSLRKKLIYDLSRTKITQAFFQNVITIILGVLKFGSIGLIIGRIVGQGSGILRLSKSLFMKKVEFKKSIKASSIKEVMKKYINFPLYTTPRRIIGDLTLALPTLAFTHMYGLKYVGYFALANSIVQLPVTIIGTSIEQVFFSEVASLKKNNSSKILALSNKFVLVLLLLGLCPLVVSVIWSEDIFEFIFGLKWIEAGKIASIISFSIYFKFVFTPISGIFDIFQKQKIALVLHSLRLFSIVVIFFVSYKLEYSIYTTLTLYSITLSILYFIQYFSAKNIMKKYT